MEITRRIQVPTGDILVVSGEKGELEMLSLGDYGKAVNLKCDAMGLGRDLKDVKHTELLPLTEKWVLTISTQYGCRQRCTFCDVPGAGSGRNASLKDLLDQISMGLSLHPEVKATRRLNIHFARMGEPTWNPAVLYAAWRLPKYLYGHRIHPVVSTMMPKRNEWLCLFLVEWMRIKNENCEGEAGLQISINSTNEDERQEMFADGALSLREIAAIVNLSRVVGRKITLNFAIADWEIDPAVLLPLFPPSRFIIKLTPMHKTAMALEHSIKTDGDYTTVYPYKMHEERLKQAGYDVLVFVASKEEDESRITCGNAILSGTVPEFVRSDTAKEES